MQNTAISHLQMTANHIETGLRLPKTLLAKLTTESPGEVKDFLAETIRTIEGVIELKLTEHTPSTPQPMPRTESTVRVYYHPLFKNNTVVLDADYAQKDKINSYSAQLTISFYDLIGRIPQAPWWSGLNTFMLDAKGNILSPDHIPLAVKSDSPTTSPYISKENRTRLQALIATSSTGIMPADDNPTPEVIYGYRTLKEAPWTMVIISDGASILKPLNTFRWAYLTTSLLITALMLFLLNLMASRIIRIAKQLAETADRLSNGYFDTPLQLDRNDEMGQLVKSFNAMSGQLQKGVKLQKSIILAGEIQQGLLPQAEYKDHKFEAFGVSLPCDETGGDFFDIIPCNRGKLFLVIGDVVGHGIGAALLMATTRALVRSEIEHADNLASCVGRVNNLLYRDTESSGSFSTLFILSLERSNTTLRWVRAGHEPAMLYNLDQGSFTELKEKGVALGINPTVVFEENSVELPPGEHLILINSDGVTDLENLHGERFGRLRLQQIVKRFARYSAEAILSAICAEIKTFANNRRPEDDITIVIAKIH